MIAAPPAFADLAHDLDFQAIVVGMPKSGKSTIARAIASTFAAAGGFVLVHDIMRDWHNEWNLPVIRSPAEYLAAFRAGTVPRVVSALMPSSGLRQMAVDIGEALNTQKQVRFPMLLCFDEASALDDSGPTHQSKKDGQATAVRRHNGVGILWNTQSVSQLTDPFWQLTTDVYAFAIQSENQIEILRSRCNLKKSALDGLPELPRFRHVHIRRAAPGAGGGIVKDAL